MTSQIIKTINNLNSTLTTFSQDQFNQVPFENSWTPAQVAVHLIKSNTGVVEVLQGNTKTPDRQSDELAEGIKSLFLDFNIKMESPENILPSSEPQQKTELLPALYQKMLTIEKLWATLPPSDLCVDFKFPVFGYLTRLEWVTFFLYHSQRHTYQLQKMLQFMQPLPSEQTN